MSDPDQIREEEQFREVERAMLYVDEAARKAADAAERLKRNGAAPHLVAALETAARSVRAEHKQLMKSVYWKAPEKSEAQTQLVAAEEDQERSAP